MGWLLRHLWCLLILVTLATTVSCRHIKRQRTNFPVTCVAFRENWSNTKKAKKMFIYKIVQKSRVCIGKYHHCGSGLDLRPNLFCRQNILYLEKLSLDHPICNPTNQQIHTQKTQFFHQNFSNAKPNLQLSNPKFQQDNPKYC